jgi:hypothetical protein
MCCQSSKLKEPLLEDHEPRLLDMECTNGMRRKGTAAVGQAKQRPAGAQSSLCHVQQNFIKHVYVYIYIVYTYIIVTVIIILITI